MKHTATLELWFLVDGREPTAEERDAILARILSEWPSRVFAYSDGYAILEQITAEWQEAQ